MQLRSTSAAVVLAALTATCSGDAPRPPTSPSPAPQTPFSIQTALDAALPGATIVVPAGTYREALRITTPGVTLRAEGEVVLDGESFPESTTTQTAGVLIQAADVTVSGLTVLRFHRGIVADVARCRITNNYVGHGRSSRTFGQGIGIELVSRQWWRQAGASDCEVSGNTVRGIDGVGILVGGDRNVVRGNFVADVQGAAGILVRSAYDSQIIDNRVANNPTGIFVGDSGSPKDTQTLRNVVADNQSANNTRYGIGVAGWYTHESRFERNRASSNGQVDLYMNPDECARKVDHVWKDNQGSRNCPAIQ
jgi:nitrous oxidase accessory protein NosD